MAFERIDADNFPNRVECLLHKSRYEYARNIIKKRFDKPLILDAACGYGYGSAILSNVGNVIGIDIDSNIIAKARSVFKKPTFSTMDATKLDFPNEHFNVIVSMETIEHMTAENGKKVINEFFRVLKPYGLLIMSSPNHVQTTRIRKKFNYAPNYFHLHEYSVDELIDVCNTTGFKKVDVCGQYVYSRILEYCGRFSFFPKEFFVPNRIMPVERCLYFIYSGYKPILNCNNGVLK